MITYNLYRFELGFPDPTWITGIWPGGHFQFHTEIDGVPISRKYTPVSTISEQGKVEFYIKIYRDNPETKELEGVFTRYLEKNVNVGDYLTCEAPCGILKYSGYGVFEYNKKPLAKYPKVK